ncbi:hypothetical protein GCM10007886_00640 [Methylobacterium gregans]|nr:hypothetical protein GCM10007886_00640 [Methylobacterium gregans]
MRVEDLKAAHQENEERDRVDPVREADHERMSIVPETPRRFDPCRFGPRGRGLQQGMSPDRATGIGWRSMAKCVGALSVAAISKT